MGCNSSWSVVASTPAGAASVRPRLAPFYLVPFVVWTQEAAGVVPAMDVQAPIAESCERRVMTTWNSDGHAYSLDEFMEYFGKAAGLEQWRNAVPVGEMERPSTPPTAKTPEVDKDDSEIFTRITKALMTLLDGDVESDSPLFRRRVRNAKLSRSAVIWTRLVKKTLLLMRHDRAGRSLSEHEP
jgi:hypothetical protein